MEKKMYWSFHRLCKNGLALRSCTNGQHLHRNLIFIQSQTEWVQCLCKETIIKKKEDAGIEPTTPRQGVTSHEVYED